MHQSSQTNFNPYQSQQQQFADPENTTVFIGGLPPEVLLYKCLFLKLSFLKVGPEELRTFFLPYGEIVHVVFFDCYYIKLNFIIILESTTG